MKTSSKFLVALLAIFVVTQAHAMRWISPNTGRWFSRDPIGEPGSILLRNPNRYNHSGADSILGVDLKALARSATDQPSAQWESELYQFNKNDAVNFIDRLGMMRIQDLLAKLQARKQANASLECCCVSPKISGSIRGMSQGGASVLADYPKDFTDVFFFHDCVFQPEIYWWDCYSASEEGGWSWNWEDYGWSGPGSYNYSKTAYPDSWSLRDPYHLAVLSLYVWDECKGGKRSTQWKASNGLQWTWDKKAKQWTGPDPIKDK